LNKKVLVIDDDPDQGKLIETILKPIELTVYHAYSGGDGLKMVFVLRPDLVILDIMMPGLDGFEVCSRLREMTDIPIIVLTALAHEKDLLRSFNVGADDFMKKPFSKNELQVRVSALLKRSNNRNSSETAYSASYTDNVLEIDLSAETIKLNGSIVKFSPREYGLLAYLVREQGKIVSNRELLREVWGRLYTNNTAEVSLYVHYLRNKLQDGQHGHQYIHSLWGQGYRFVPRKEINQELCSLVEA
jgi:two-component system response regulator ArlR